MKRLVALIALTFTVTSAPAATARHDTDPLSELASLARRSGSAGLTQPAADGARQDFDALVARPPRTQRDRHEALKLAAELLPRLLRARIQPSNDPARFTVWKPSDNATLDKGGNPVLRADIAAFAADARRLRALFENVDGAEPQPIVTAQLEMMVLLARYRSYIGSNWTISASTNAAFDAAKQVIADNLVEDALRQAAGQASWTELVTLRVSEAPHPSPRPAPAPEALHDNPFMSKVDAAISNPRVRQAIRAVQPAAVKIGGGSGVNIAASGLILTNAHVAKAVGNRFVAIFPDGREISGRATAVNAHLDLALVTLDPQRVALPTAPIARSAPTVGTRVVIIGNPGTRTPDGEPTGYQRFHVSTGAIRELAAEPLGSQSLGGVGHDAWTYWGHSGSPLFNEAGAVVALHNSWESTTAMRHAVTWQAIYLFLTDNGAFKNTHNPLF